MEIDGVSGALGAQDRANSRPGEFRTVGGVYENSGGWREFRCLEDLCSCVMVGRVSGADLQVWKESAGVWVVSNDWVLGVGGEGGWMSVFRTGRSAGGGGWGAVWVRSGGVDAVFVVGQVRGWYCALCLLTWRGPSGVPVQCVSK